MAKTKKAQQNDQVVYTYYVYEMGGTKNAAYCISKDFFSIKTAILAHRVEGSPDPVVLGWQSVTEGQLIDLVGAEVVIAGKKKALGTEEPTAEEPKQQ